MAVVVCQVYLFYDVIHNQPASQPVRFVFPRMLENPMETVDIIKLIMITIFNREQRKRACWSRHLTEMVKCSKFDKRALITYVIGKQYSFTCASRCFLRLCCVSCSMLLLKTFPGWMLLLLFKHLLCNLTPPGLNLNDRP